MVRYKGWVQEADVIKYMSKKDPIGLVVEQRSPDDDFHHRIRVMWIGEEIPIQASALSTSGNRITTWVKPKCFEVIGESR